MATTALSAGSKVGRAFSVVSFIPSVFLVMLVWALAASGALGGSPNPSELATSFEDLSLGAVGLALLIAFAVGYLLHPLQFALTQLLEGYWGTSHVGQSLMIRSIKRNRLRKQDLDKQLAETQLRLNELDFFTRKYPEESEVGADPVVALLVAEQQLDKALADLPTNNERVMPTRLGNVLRRHEDLAGKAYGLSGVEVIPALTLAADRNHHAYMNEAAEQMDAAVSVCTVTFLATVIIAATTLTDGWWLLISLVPYAVCLIAYRGAVTVAHSYGIAMRHLFDLDRFALYEAMRLRLPTDDDEEEITAAVVNSQIRGERVETSYFRADTK